ncbi:hypothetical protein DEU56DRAFT_164806 [Suillus clintonianus]|uniref:uncharacterized protein n=1 Tax=Suillus clintonianus TaxID=1904413 RepID=UPI001B877D5C|nr:uncharacterized protein DEU56DRAFT_164806 [Suillus clintonianus]KAG2116784.1 hypothetical protein DEU56DRAFT_164806 [Suillus clintonianus]
MDQHANQIDQSGIAGLPHPQLPPHPHPQLPPHPHPQLPPHHYPQLPPHHYPQLPPHPHPLPQHQRFGLYHPIYPCQLIAPVPASTAYGIANTVSSAGVPRVMQHMMWPIGVPLPFPTQFPQPHMVSGPPYGYSFLPPLPYGAYAPGPQAVGVAQYHYQSVPSTVQSIDVQHLEQGPMQQARVGKRKAVDDDAVGRETRTKRPRVYHGIPPDFTPVLEDGEVKYKCSRPQCAGVRPMKKGSIRNHIGGSNTHNESDGQFTCSFCDGDYSRSDSLNRHLKTCPKGPAAVGPETNDSPSGDDLLEEFANSVDWE